MSILAVAGLVTLSSCKKKVNPGFTADPTTAKVGQPVNFMDSETADRKNATVTWDFGDGSKSWDRNPSHIFWTPGTYTVHQTVTINKNEERGKGVSETAMLEVTIEAAGATTSVFAASATTVAKGQPVTFTNTSTIANMFTWTVSSSNGGVPMTYGPTGVKDLTLSFTDAGTYTITLTAGLSEDPHGYANSSSTTTVTVTGTAPVSNADEKGNLVGTWSVGSCSGAIAGNGSTSPFNCTAYSIADGTYASSPAPVSLRFYADGTCSIVMATGNQTTGTFGTWDMNEDGTVLMLAGGVATALMAANPGTYVSNDFAMAVSGSSLSISNSEKCPTVGVGATRSFSLTATK